MNEHYSFKNYLGRNWWFLLLAFAKIFNQSERESAFGSLFLDTIFFGGIIFVISNTGIDMLFHPDTGIIKGEVKKFDKEAFYILYEMTILFLISHFKNVSLERAEKSKELFINTVNRVEECNALWNEVDEFTKSSNKMIDRVVQKVSSYTGELTKDKKPALVSAFRGLVVSFIQAI